MKKTFLLPSRNEVSSSRSGEVVGRAARGRAPRICSDATGGGGGEETLMQGAGGVMRDGATVSGTMLTLVSRSFDVTRRDGYGCPAFATPARVIDSRRVVVAGDFATNGPKETYGRRRVHGKAGSYAAAPPMNSQENDHSVRKRRSQTNPILRRLFTRFFSTVRRDPDVMTVAAVPVEMSIPAPPESTDNDMARLSALVALCVGSDCGLGVRGTPRHKPTTVAEFQYS
jgi:hypothetical protein